MADSLVHLFLGHHLTLNQMGQGILVFPDGLMSIEIGSGGEGVLSLEPYAGPALVIHVSPNGSVQVSGDVTATLQSMPITFAGPLGQDLMGFGLDLGFIEPEPAGGFRPVPAALAQWFGAGNQCNYAAGKAFATLAALVAGGVKCSQGDAGACGALPLAGYALFEAISAEWHTCLNFSN